MRVAQMLLLVVATFIVCCSAVTDAENSIQDNASTTDSTAETTAKGHRYLKGSKTTSDVVTVDEERFTPKWGMYLGGLKLPKFQSLSKLPLVKQLAAIKSKLGKKVADLYTKWVKKRYESNPQNFM
uniref:RxLR effector protein n=1 Tax=Phytophthora ramorum TaxID=164328 RepID=H3GPY4_PHYRM|nr:RXLR-class effector Avh108 [Phytophthora ramorum]AGZ84853.1 RXLR-class effector Avh108 [Phytophthora ramorum]